MKIATLALFLIFLVLPAGCSGEPHRITAVDSRSVTRIVVTDLILEKSVELIYGPADPEKYVKAFQEAEVEYAGECEPAEDEHLFRVEIYVGDTLDSDIYISSDSFCRSGRRREIVGDGFEITIFEELFENVAVETEDGWYFTEAPVTYSVPLKAPGQTRWKSTRQLAETELWSYFISAAEIGGEQGVVVVREGKGHDTEIIFGCLQAKPESWPIEYVENSFEKSGQMYFSIMSPDGYYMLYGFNLKDEVLTLVFDRPCSNMVIIDETDDIGWIIHEDKITAVNLKSGSVNEELSAETDSLEGLPYFFSEPSEGYDHKYVSIQGADGNTLEITVTETDSSGKNSDLEVTYMYDVLNKTVG